MLMAPSLLSPWPPFHSAGHQICDPTPHCMRLCCWVPLRKPWPQWSTEPSQGSVRVLADPLCPPISLSFCLLLVQQCTNTFTGLTHLHESAFLCCLCVFSRELNYLACIKLPRRQINWVCCFRHIHSHCKELSLCLTSVFWEPASLKGFKAWELSV